MLLLTDNQFVEGIIGGCSTFVIMELLKKKIIKKNNLFIVVLICWALFWFIRKIGINLYKQIKQKYNIKNRKLNIQNKHFLFVFSVLLSLLCVFIIRHKQSLYFKQLTIVDYTLLCIIFVIGFFVYGL